MLRGQPGGPRRLCEARLQERGPASRALQGRIAIEPLAVAGLAGALRQLEHQRLREVRRDMLLIGRGTILRLLVQHDLGPELATHLGVVLVGQQPHLHPRLPVHSQ